MPQYPQRSADLNPFHPTQPTPAVPDGVFSVVFDNSPISLEGRRLSRRQIQHGLKKGILQPGMRFRHPRYHKIDFVLTPAGLAWPQRRSATR